jgi:hypothetical protein
VTVPETNPIPEGTATVFFDRPAAKKVSPVVVVRLPKGATHPQAVYRQGVLHVLYFKGEPKQGDVYYVRSNTPPVFTAPLRVNSQANGAALAGGVHGPQLAVDERGQAHVAWVAGPGAEGGNTCYARTSADGGKVELRRSLAGGSPVAVAAGHDMVYLCWQGTAAGEQERQAGRVWLAKSVDGGKTFAAAAPISPPGSAVCADHGLCALYTYPRMPVVLYGEAAQAQRSVSLLYEDPRASRFQRVKVQEWKSETSPRGTAALLDQGNDYLAAWEAAGDIHFTRIPHLTGKVSRLHTVPGRVGNRTRPAIASTGRATLLVWMETAVKGQPPSAHWQLYDNKDLPTANRGEEAGVPTGSHAAVVPNQTGQFLLLY